jgi:hypothetical protein
LEQLLRIRNFVNDKDSKGNINIFVKLWGKAKSVGSTLVRPDTRYETLLLHLFPQDAEHLFLYVHSDYVTSIANSFGKLAGEKTRPAAKIKDTVTGFYVPLCKAIRPVKEPPEAGVEVPGSGGRKNLVVVRGRGFQGTCG